MKTLRRPCAVLVLTLALALSAFAGEMQTGITAPPPPDATTTGDIATGVTATDPVTETALNLLQSVLSLF